MKDIVNQREIPLLRILPIIGFYVLLELNSASSFGFILNIGLFIFTIILLLYKFVSGFKFLLLTSLIQSPFPNFDGYSNHLGYSLYTINIGISLVHILNLLCFTLFLIIFIIKIRGKLEKSLLAILIFLGFVLLVQMIIGYTNKFNIYQYLIDNLLLITSIGFFFINSIMSKDIKIRESLIDLLVYSIPISLGISSVFTYFLSERFTWYHGTYNTNSVYILVSLLFIVFGPKNKWRSMGVVGLISFLTISILTVLGSIMIVAIVLSSIIILLWYLKFTKKIKASGRIRFSLIIVMILIVFIMSFNNKIGEIQFKIDQINSLFNDYESISYMQHSSAIRLIEFKNIIGQITSTPVHLLFGNGAGGYFTEDNLNFPYVTETDYSYDQATSGKYYKPHNNPNLVLLKNGFLGLLSILVLLLFSIYNGLKKSYLLLTIASIFTLDLALVYGFSVQNCMIVGLFGGLFWASNRYFLDENTKNME